MKYIIIFLTTSRWVFRNPKDGTKRATLIFPVLALAAGLVLAANPAQAATNILGNPGFEVAPYGHTYPTNPPVAYDWTYFSPPEPPSYFGDYWVQTLSTDHGVAAHSGSYYWNQWSALNAGNTNVAGIYQTLSSSPGSIYQASGWISAPSTDNGGLSADALTWIQVEFLDVNTNLLALYKSGNYSASVGYDTWFQYQVKNACDISLPLSTGDPYFTTYAVTGSVSQLVAPFGTTAVRYRYAALFQTGGKGSADLDDAVLNQVSGPVPPVINNLFPQNMIFVNPASNISFNVSSPSGFTINSNAIHMVLNGTDVSTNLAISGSASSKNVVYSGLQSNLSYTVSISATDASNLTANASTYFQTMWFGIQPVTYLWEAEDWDFTNGTTNGMYINNPDLCSAPGDPFCYFGKVGVQGADENNTSGASGPFRPGDPMGTKPSGDYLRPNLFAAGATDYKIDPFNGTGGSYVGSEWVNYTRDWPNSTNWIIARLATDIGLSGSLLLSQITPTATNNLGTFTINGGLGYTTYEYVYLKDTNGNNANVVLNGKETLRVTSGGNLLPNFYMLVPAVLDLPLLSNLYPTGKNPFEPTNALSFTVTTSGATFPTNGIKVNLDGNDVSLGLVITGSASAKNVVYPTLQLNAVHTAIITVTNSLGHGISVTYQFDTFNQSNYMFEAEDFDYNGGQFVSNWQPDAYQNFVSVSNIDFQHTFITNEDALGPGSEYQYRQNGIPQQLLNASGALSDYLRQVFVSAFASDYYLYWFGGPDWANYTRVYPTGNFYVYARSAGAGTNSMYLDQVISGAGSTNQVTKHFGQFYAVQNQPFAWVPLTDDGLVAPVVVKLGGTNTLRISTITGNCYPNYFMLVPASGINLSAARSGNNINISFPTQLGSGYRVFYRTDLTTGNWTLLNTVLGNGSVEVVTNSSPAGNQQFYKVTSP
jgi:hypothetical protein